MFNPADFKLPEDSTVVLCNSAHPVLKYLSNPLAKIIPKTVRDNSSGENWDGVYYVATKQNDFVVTYRSTDHSIQLWRTDIANFKQRLMDNTYGYIRRDSVVMVPSDAKYIGNTILEEIEAYLF